MNILVTGGAGFIGSHACKALSQAGFRPVVLDNLSTGFRHNVKWGPLVVGELGEAGVVQRVFAEHRIDGVLHFAASAYVGVSVTQPLDYYRNNVATTLTLLEVMREHGFPPLVFSSSCATYGTPAEVPIPVTHAQIPINPYGWTKLMGERMILDASHAYGLRAAILRYFNAAGADPEGDLREEHDPETHLLPLAIDAALGTRGPLQVFGDDYPTPDGTCIRDYIHVSDLAALHVQALRHLLAGAPTFVRNLGTGHGHSVKEVLEAVRHCTGRPVPHEIRGRREGDPAALTAIPDAETTAALQFADLPRLVATAVASRRPAS
jgi:UDP-glucose-4-epimerase GalE